MEDSVSRNLAHGIPHDLILEILPRLPAKSLIRFQSVSKLWFSIIRSKDFPKSFLTHSRTRPRILFTVNDSSNQFIFSAPEYDTNNSSSVVVKHDMTISGFVYTIGSRPVNGFFCCLGPSYIVVCNPTTRQIVKLPDLPPALKGLIVGYLNLGYDPVESHYKVLCVMKRLCTKEYKLVYEQLVCTVKSGENEEWRKIETIREDLYTIILDGICIDGAIYFGVGHNKIARFDVRTEKIDFIQGPQGYKAISRESTLINYHRKLGVIKYDSGIHMWTLEKEERTWNYVTCNGPYEWDDFLRHKKTYFPGQMHTGELMMFTHDDFKSCKPFSFFCCDLIRKSIRRVEVHGLADPDFRRIHGINTHAPAMLCSPCHIENFMFL